ncbi:MAG: ATP-binding cassette domain-containing protein [Actinomycetota bacterium]|nr:ATP-binding cassette domain-containing protein [Actinomycetota bacterium]
MSSPSSSSFLTIEHVAKHFGGLPAISDVSLGVDEGEICALVGPNGAGKSTLLKAISGIQPATRGRIRLGGDELTGRAAHDVRQRGVAMVLQTPRVFETMTVLDNVVVGALFGATRPRLSEDEAVDRALEALGFVGLTDRWAAEVGELNLHEQRFLEMARALAARPRLLLLDEVMAGLNDTELAASIEIVRRVRDELGVTIIWVEHVMSAVMRLAERVVVLDFGQVLADGRPDEVMRRPEVVTAYLGTGTAVG